MRARIGNVDWLVLRMLKGVVEHCSWMVLWVSKILDVAIEDSGYT